MNEAHETSVKDVEPIQEHDIVMMVTEILSKMQSYPGFYHSDSMNTADGAGDGQEVWLHVQTTKAKRGGEVCKNIMFLTMNPRHQARRAFANNVVYAQEYGKRK